MLGGKSNEFEVMSRKLLVLFLFCFLFASLVSAAPISKVYNIELTSNGNEVALSNLNLEEGFSNIPLNIFPEDYILKIISHEETVYQEYPIRFYFDVLKSVSEECFIEEGIVEMLNCKGSSYTKLNDSIVILNVPFSPNAKFLRLYSPEGNLIVQEDISRLSCGNLVCDNHENEESCMEDCSHGKFVFNRAMLTLGLVLFILAVLIFIFWELISRQRKFKDKVFYFCRWLKNVGINSISNN